MDPGQILNTLNWQGILAVLFATWFFTRDIRDKMSRLDTDMRAQGARIDRLYQMFVDLLKERK